MSILKAEGSGSRFWTLIVLGRDGLSRCSVGEGGNVRYGGIGDGRCLVVCFGSKSNEAGVQRVLMIANASFDPYVEAVVARGKQKKQMICFLQDQRARNPEYYSQPRKLSRRRRSCKVVASNASTEVRIWSVDWATERFPFKGLMWGWI